MGEEGWSTIPRVCVRVRAAPSLCVYSVKYERAGVKPAIDRGKRERKRKECERRSGRVEGAGSRDRRSEEEERSFQPHLSRELQESALSTLESSYVSPAPIVSAAASPSPDPSSPPLAPVQRRIPLCDR